jgi:hypothetical protein
LFYTKKQYGTQGKNFTGGKIEVEEFLNAIKLCITDLQSDGDNRVLLSDLGNSLREMGFDYRAYGFEKLSHLLKEHEELFKVVYTTANPYAPPICSVCLNSHLNIRISRNTKPIANRGDENNPLASWANLGGNAEQFYEDLSKFALPETWSFGNSAKNSILKNYMKYTFLKLKAENKIVAVDGYASFNTGLVDKLYRPIYALFKATNQVSNAQRSNDRAWSYYSFCVIGEGPGKILSRDFPTIPDKALYLNYDKHQEFIYDTRKGQPVIDAEHIIIANLRRLPKPMIDACLPTNMKIKDFESSYGTISYNKLKQEVEQNDLIRKNLYNTLQSAVGEAFNKVKWNYRIAIPIYYPKNNSISLLLPLALSDQRTNLALICEWQPKAQRYQAHTILPLDMAYKCARLINRLDSAWLSPNEIMPIAYNEDEED